MPHAAPAGFQHGLTLAAAQTIAQQTLAKGREMGLAPLTVVVLDGAGQLKAALREDGASLGRVDIAWGKANGCLALGFGSRELQKRAQATPAFIGALTTLQGGYVVPVAGGLLVKDRDGAVLGAVGVSGDLSDKDEEAALAGIAAAGLVAETGA